MHVNLSHYLDTLRCILPRELLLQQAHRHLMDLCPVCRGEWDGRPHFNLAPATDGGSLEEPDLATRPIPSKRDFSLTLYEQEHARLSRMRAIARRAREDVARLRRLPAARWPATVARSKTRFRSRAFVLLLLDESKRAVRTAPHEAAAFAALVPLALDQRKGREAMAWARELRALAAAHHANALRIAGDLPGADREFAALRKELQRTSPASADTDAEIASLEASLRIDQRRFDDAERLLVGAARGAERLAGRIFVKHANLLMTLGHAEHALDRFERAAATLDPASEPHLHLCIVTGRVNCLCDLDRYREAGRLLAAERAAYLDAGDIYSSANYTAFQARVNLGLGRPRKPSAASGSPATGSLPSTATTMPSSQVSTSLRRCSPQARWPSCASSPPTWCPSSRPAASSGRPWPRCGSSPRRSRPRRSQPRCSPSCGRACKPACRRRSRRSLRRRKASVERARLATAGARVRRERRQGEGGWPSTGSTTSTGG